MRKRCVTLIGVESKISSGSIIKKDGVRGGRGGRIGAGVSRINWGCRCVRHVGKKWREEKRDI